MFGWPYGILPNKLFFGLSSGGVDSIRRISVKMKPPLTLLWDSLEGGPQTGQFGVMDLFW